MTAKRALGGVLLPSVLVGLAVVPFLVLRDRLPDPVATHWDLSGTPDGSMSQLGLLVLVGVLAGLGGAGLVVLGTNGPMDRGIRGVLSWVSGFVAALFAGISVLTVVVNLDTSNWRQADDVGFIRVALMILAAVGGGVAAGYLLQRHDDLSPANNAEALPSAGLRMGERATWLGICRSKWMYVFGVIELVISAAVGLLVGVVPGILLAIVAFAVMAFGSIRVATNQRGLTVWYTPLSWPRTQVPLERIVAAEAIDVSPMKHGGWGYRGSLKLFGMAAVVLRKGEGIRLELDNGKLFVVTVDDAHTGAGVINDLLGLSTSA